MVLELLIITIFTRFDLLLKNCLTYWNFDAILKASDKLLEGAYIIFLKCFEIYSAKKHAQFWFELQFPLKSKIWQKYKMSTQAND